jgi:transcriptional regulator GlxA family with amidase domain
MVVSTQMQQCGAERLSWDELALSMQHRRIDVMKEMIVSSVFDKATKGPCATPRAAGRVSTARRNPTLAPFEADSVVLPALPARLKGGLPPRALRRVRDHIDAHLGERLDNATLAAVAALSSSHFVRAFKQSVGVTPHHYVVRRRVERVKEILADTDLRLAEIAMAVGFADQSHCARCFRTHVGMRPRDYRWSMR